MYSGVHEKALCVVGGVVLQHVSLLVFPPRRAAAGGARCPPAPAPAPPDTPRRGWGTRIGKGCPAEGGDRIGPWDSHPERRASWDLVPLLTLNSSCVGQREREVGCWAGEGEAEDVMGRPDLGN